MKLLTIELRRKFPKLYSQEEKDPKDVKIIAKFFCPWNQWTWFATEANSVLEDGTEVEASHNGQQKEVDVLFFGYVKGLENELGNFSLKEMEAVKGPAGLGIERDLYYGDKHTLAEVMADD